MNHARPTFLLPLQRQTDFGLKYFKEYFMEVLTVFNGVFDSIQA